MQLGSAAVEAWLLAGVELNIEELGGAESSRFTGCCCSVLELLAPRTGVKLEVDGKMGTERVCVNRLVALGATETIFDVAGGER